MNNNKIFDRSKLKIFPLSCRESKSDLSVIIDPEIIPEKSPNLEKITKIAEKIIYARKSNSFVMLSFGAHLIKNGLSLILRKLIEENYVTHLASNGAVPIHDWEFAYQGKTEEDVRKYIKEGQFGIWEETNKYINLAIISGASRKKGYGESICEMINKDRIEIPEKIIDSAGEKLSWYNINPGDIISINHKYKNYSFQDKIFGSNTTFTVHPHFGHDIIYNHPLSDGASIGLSAEIDFLKFAKSVSNLDGGVYLSVGSGIMSPMVFEKTLSMARNLAHQKGKVINNFTIVVNDIQEGEWEWGSGKEPQKNNPSYYQRFCKTFDRMNAKEMIYIKEDNRSFMRNLYHELKNIT